MTSNHLIGVNSASDDPAAQETGVWRLAKEEGTPRRVAATRRPVGRPGPDLADPPRGRGARRRAAVARDTAVMRLLSAIPVHDHANFHVMPRSIVQDR